MGAIPKTETDEERRTVALTLDIDEGKAWDFGLLLLEGPEPYAGAGNALVAAWTLEGGTFQSRASNDVDRHECSVSAQAR